MAEQLLRIGVPVFMADVKGDLSGLAQAGDGRVRSSRSASRSSASPTAFAAGSRSCSGTCSASRATRCAPRSPTWGRCCSRLLNLNDTQEGVLNIAFKIADDQGLLLLDLKDLRAMLQYVGENAKQFTTEYGNVSAASIGAIQRGLLVLESRAATKFFGEPALDIADLMQTDADGRGVINILAADKLMTTRPSSTPPSCCGCCRSCSSSCPKSATSTSRSWCSSSTRRTCCSTMRPRRCSRRSSRWCA
jgi:DNA helicase HerA-like ATPase